MKQGVMNIYVVATSSVRGSGSYALMEKKLRFWGIFSKKKKEKKRAGAVVSGVLSFRVISFGAEFPVREISWNFSGTKRSEQRLVNRALVSGVRVIFVFCEKKNSRNFRETKDKVNKALVSGVRVVIFWRKKNSVQEISGKIPKVSRALVSGVRVVCVQFHVAHDRQIRS